MKKRENYKHQKALELFDLYEIAKDRRIVKNQGEFSEKMGFGRTTLFRLLNEAPDEITDEILINAKKVSETNYVPRIPLKKSNEANKDNNNEDLSMETIRDLAKSGLVLAESIKIHSEAIRVQAEAHLKEADNRSGLISAVNFTAGVQTEMSIIQRAVPGLLEKIAKSGVGKHWNSEESGLEILNMLLHESEAANKKSNKSALLHR